MSILHRLYIYVGLILHSYIWRRSVGSGEGGGENHSRLFCGGGRSFVISHWGMSRQHRRGDSRRRWAS
ncbi:hypothetical protein [Anabaena azotica]|uniref:Secreted protein n=1 Tax=Anabaena azotica FACHB-119 TaxID=947527 RepID=A0ABR8DEE6_9NOST|nr:hypothetical protein [Anabaena azotica]MBD2505302.1 hypothetical protein [Anabaena azotica FACHB-119]